MSAQRPDNGPIADLIAESERITDAAAGSGVTLKLMGGAAICRRSPSARRVPLKRRYGDLDFATLSKQRKAVQELFPGLGYEAEERFNLMQGDRRLMFLDAANNRQVDIFLDVVKMSHVIDLRSRLGGDGPCMTPADLLLSKLQIYEANRKDVVDVVALLLDHPISDTDEDAVDGSYVARLAAQDWGLHRTLQLNTERVRSALGELDVPTEVVERRLDDLWRRIDAEPKSSRWRLRARVGDRKRWYELPEEVRSPYEPG
jgi:hypothetical protein